MSEQAAVPVHRDDENHRYEATLDATVAGFVQFRERAGRVILIHTETDPAFEGHGVGSALARASLDDVRARGLKAVLECPFITSYVSRHPEYQDLITT
jgi:predicted GNAT family acetyltransferase